MIPFNSPQAFPTLPFLSFSHLPCRLRWKNPGNSYHVAIDMLPSHCSCLASQSLKSKKEILISLEGRNPNHMLINKPGASLTSILKPKKELAYLLATQTRTKGKCFVCNFCLFTFSLQKALGLQLPSFLRKMKAGKMSVSRFLTWELRATAYHFSLYFCVAFRYSLSQSDRVKASLAGSDHFL